jgi:hypothetical protein
VDIGLLSQTLNLGVMCDCLSLLFHVLLIFHISRVLGNRINFLTTGIRAFGSSVSDGKRRMKDRDREVRRHRILGIGKYKLKIFFMGRIFINLF